VSFPAKMTRAIVLTFIRNVGVHGVKADLHLETLWAKNIAITTRLVDTSTTPMLLKLLVAGKLPAAQMITHSKLIFLDLGTIAVNVGN
jgi:alcohol dehydrogenase